MFKTRDLILVEQKMGIGNVKSPNFSNLVITNSVKSLLSALQSLKMTMESKKKLAACITKTYPSLLDIRNSDVILIVSQKFLISSNEPSHALYPFVLEFSDIIKLE